MKHNLVTLQLGGNEEMKMDTGTANDTVTGGKNTLEEGTHECDATVPDSFGGPALVDCCGGVPDCSCAHAH